MSNERYQCKSCGFIFNPYMYGLYSSFYCLRCGTKCVMGTPSEIANEIMSTCFDGGIVSCSQEAGKISILVKKLKEMAEGNKLINVKIK